MSPRTTLPQRRGLETRQQILDAAYRVFVRAGFGAASVDEIVTEADVSKGAVYHHFSGKDEMFREILGEHVRRCAEQMTEAIDSGASLRANVENILRASWQSVRSDPAWPALQMEFWVHATRDEHARQIVAESMTTCRRLVAGNVAALQEAGVLTRPLDADTAARLFLGVNDGILLQWQLQPDEVDPDALLAPMAEMITFFLTCDDESTRR
jgi:AcrR family transcriptional regulator